MELNALWFILIAVLFIGFFFLEGFDYGVGILMPFLGKNDEERRVVINTIGPFWDGNEVWLLTAGGAMFAAFPNWYATLFSGFYLPLFLILLALIVRGVAFEFRSKDDNPTWRRTWDWALFIGSALPALLWGVAFANVVRGVPIDETMTYTGGFFNLLNPYALVGGIVTLSLFILHGAIFLSLKADDVIRVRAERVARLAWWPTTISILLFVVLSFSETTMFADGSILKFVAVGLAVVALLFTFIQMRRAKFGWAFIGTGLTIVLTVLILFAGLFPNVMPSSTDPNFSLTIYNASSSDYTLSIMTVIALFFVPIVIGYQAWTYWVFRKRVTLESHLEY